MIVAKGEKKVIEEKKIMTETRYCHVYKSVSIIDDDYYSSIEKIKVKIMKRSDLHCTKIHLKWGVSSFIEVWI